MFRAFLALLVILLCLSFLSCGGDDVPEPSGFGVTLEDTTWQHTVVKF